MDQRDLESNTRVAADEAIRVARAGHFQRAEIMARQALANTHPGDLAGRLNALTALAIVQGAGGRFIESIASCIDAFDWAQRLGDHHGALHAAVTMVGSGTFILDAGSSVDTMLGICREHASALGDVALQVRVENNFGIFCEDRGRFEEGLAANQRALDLLALGVARAELYTPRTMLQCNRASILGLYASSFSAGEGQEIAQQAKGCFESLIADPQLATHRDAQARLWFGLGGLQWHLGKLDAALQSFEASREQSRQTQHRSRELNASLQLARIHRQRGDHEAAVALLDHAVQLGESIRPTMHLAPACAEMAEALDQLGREKEAAWYRERLERERDFWQRENTHAARDIASFAVRLTAFGRAVA